MRLRMHFLLASKQAIKPANKKYEVEPQQCKPVYLQKQLKTQLATAIISLWLAETTSVKAMLTVEMFT